MKNISISPAAREAIMRDLASMDYPDPIPWLALTGPQGAAGAPDLQWEIVYCNRTPDLEQAIITVDGIALIAHPECFQYRRTRRLHIGYTDGRFDIREDRDEEP